MCSTFASILAVLAAALLGAAIPSGWIHRAAQGPSSRPVRVLLAAPRSEASLQSSTPWRLLDINRRVIAEGRAGDRWRIEPVGNRLRMSSPGGVHTALYEGPAVLERSDTANGLAWNARHYRGVLLLMPIDTALLVVNKLDVEDYLRGVVLLEIGASAPDAHAAVEAQAVAARSFTYTRMLYSAQRDYDLTASPNDQVYGGVEAESFIGDLAVAATAGWVLSFGGRVVSAPYHSTYGGNTAEPSEVWRSPDEPYLRSVSDRIPGTARFYCDISPLFRWRRILSAESLSAAIAQPHAGTSSCRAVLKETFATWKLRAERLRDV